MPNPRRPSCCRSASNKAYATIEERIPGTTRAAVNESAIGIKSVESVGSRERRRVGSPRGRSRCSTPDPAVKPFERWKVIDERRWRFTAGPSVQRAADR